MKPKAQAGGEIAFTATVYKVQTLVDGGIRVTLDLLETAIPEAAQLMECKRMDTPLLVICNHLEG